MESTPGLSIEELTEALRRELVEISEGELSLEEIDPEAHILDFGYVDSLRAVMLLARIEERFGVEIEDMELLESLTTLRSIATRVSEAS